MHVRFVLPAEERYTPAGGGAVATVTRSLAGELLARGVEVSVVTPDDGDPTYEVGDVSTLPYGRAHVASRVASRLAGEVISRTARRGTFDPVYISLAARHALHGPRPDVIVLANDPWLAMRLVGSGARVVLWLHNLLTGAAAAAVRTLPGAVAVVAVSDAVRRHTADTTGLGHGRITVIHNAVDHALFRPIERPLSNGLTVACHGRIDPNKGLVPVATAVADLRAAGRDITLLVAGREQTFGFPAAKMAAFHHELDAELARADARRTGHVPHDRIPELLHRADVACHLPLVDEPFSLAALEAMACGLAVVAMPRGGLREVVGDAAVTVASATPALVSAALTVLLDDPDEMRRRQQAATAQAATFTWAASVDRLLAVLGAPA